MPQTLPWRRGAPSNHGRSRRTIGEPDLPSPAEVGDGPFAPNSRRRGCARRGMLPGRVIPRRGRRVKACASDTRLQSQETQAGDKGACEGRWRKDAEGEIGVRIKAWRESLRKSKLLGSITEIETSREHER